MFTALFSVPVGVGSAVYLEEIAKDSPLIRIIKINLANLAGVPSIVYGILGYTVFRTSAAAIATLFDGQHVIGVLGLFKVRLSKLPIYEDNILVGALTLTLVILPTVIAASQEALRSVPSSIRVASLALGATRWQTIWRQVIPAALPGISTGVILSTSRAIGEAAPLIMLGALTYTSMCPGGIESPLQLATRPTQVMHAPLDQFTAMPIEIYDWSKQPDARFTAVAASGIVVLLVVLLSINSVAMVVRHFASRRLKW
jgi:phosphate transport system permease protein